VGAVAAGLQRNGAVDPKRTIAIPRILADVYWLDREIEMKQQGMQTSEALRFPRGVRLAAEIDLPKVEKLRFVDEFPMVTERLSGDPSSHEIITKIVTAFAALPPR